LQGRVVETHGRTALQDENATLDVHDVLAGVYLLRVTDTEGHSYSQKVMIR